MNNFFIIGIKTFEKDYKIAWNLNLILKISFSKSNIDDFNIYSSNYKNKKIFLIENKSKGNILFNDLKEFNFILKVFSTKDVFVETYTLLKKSNSFDFIYSIPLDQISKKTFKLLDNLII